MRPLLLALLFAACSPGLPPADSTPPVSSSAPGIPPTVAPPEASPAASAPAPAPDATPSQFVARARQDDPQEILAPFALNSQLPVRKRLLSWTTKTQADKLRRTKTLLSKTAQELENNSIFEETIKNITTYDTSHRIALFLRRAPVNRRRYAFSNALGWSVGVAGKPYGEVLLRVTLRDEAVLLGIGAGGDPGLHPFRAMDLRGERVPVEELTAHPERIAVVFHEGMDPGGIRFREYVLVNEGMVESWAIGTEDVLAELRKSREALERLVKVSPEQAIQEDTGLPSLWTGTPSTWPHAPWFNVLGTNGPPYFWSKANVQHILQQLDPSTQPAALEHQPKKATLLRLPAAPPPPPQPPPSKYKKRPIELF